MVSGEFALPADCWSASTNGSLTRAEQENDDVSRIKDSVGELSLIPLGTRWSATEGLCLFDNVALSGTPSGDNC